MLVSPNGAAFDFSSRLDFYCTNNQAEYEALLFGLELLQSMRVRHAQTFGDSQLVVQQILGESQCLDGALNSYLDRCLDVINCFDEFNIRHLKRTENYRANNLAQRASGYHVKKGRFHITKEPMIEANCAEQHAPELPVGCAGTSGARDSPAIGVGSSGGVMETLILPIDDLVRATTDEGDWRVPFITYLRNPNTRTERRIRWAAFKFVLIDDELYHRTPSGVLLKCLGPDDSILSMAEVHEGICGTHQSALKMKWLLRRAGFYWPTMIADCFKYYRGCQVCQQFGDVQIFPAAKLHPIIKPWPFRGWGLDFNGEIHPSSSKGHRFVLVATDYFTKWTETVALKNMTHKEVNEFITEHIFHRFGIPQTLSTDQGTSFMSREVRDFAESYKIKLLNSSPYYAQANGQAESSNKTLIGLIKKKIADHPRRWHEVRGGATGWSRWATDHPGSRPIPSSTKRNRKTVCLPRAYV